MAKIACRWAGKPRGLALWGALRHTLGARWYQRQEWWALRAASAPHLTCDK